jgi:hypothetical protein
LSLAERLNGVVVLSLLREDYAEVMMCHGELEANQDIVRRLGNDRGVQKNGST